MTVARSRCAPLYQVQGNELVDDLVGQCKTVGEQMTRLVESAMQQSNSQVWNRTSSRTVAIAHVFCICLRGN